AVLQAAEAVGFYGVSSLKESAKSTRPKVGIGLLLLQTRRAFYKNLGKAFQTAAEAVRDHEVRVRVEHLDELSPQRVSDGLNALAESSDVLGVVAAEHPVVSSTIEALAERNIKTFALISQLTARCNVGYVGLDNWKVGRTSGWAFDNICKEPGKIGILVGNH